jgi:hypothetical protein
VTFQEKSEGEVVDVSSSFCGVAPLICRLSSTEVESSGHIVDGVNRPFNFSIQERSTSAVVCRVRLFLRMNYVNSKILARAPSLLTWRV